MGSSRKLLNRILFTLFALILTVISCQVFAAPDESEGIPVPKRGDNDYTPPPPPPPPDQTPDAGRVIVGPPSSDDSNAGQPVGNIQGAIYSGKLWSSYGGGVSASNKSKPASTANTEIKSCSSSPASSHPVILATGEKYKIEHDIVASGRYGLSLDRTYRSFGNGRMFGNRWSSSFDFPLLRPSGCVKSSDYPGLCLPTSVLMTFPDGTSYTYKSTNGFTFTVANSSALGTMEYSPGQRYFINMGSVQYAYTSAGAIQYVHGSGGETLLQFTYASPFKNLPSQVSNGSGQFINFTYNSNGYVSVATDGDGNQWQYG